MRRLWGYEIALLLAIRLVGPVPVEATGVHHNGRPPERLKVSGNGFMMLVL
jgi:hypothetical protein